jgi:hypothetical protein
MNLNVGLRTLILHFDFTRLPAAVNKEIEKKLHNFEEHPQ